MSDVNDGSKYPEGTLSEDGHMVVRGGEWGETELGQHDRWLRQAPDLFGLYQAALEVVARQAQEIQRLNAMRTHCEHCGADYLATGIEAGCPCRLVQEIQDLRTERDTLARQLAKVDECLGFPDGNGSGRVELLANLSSSRDALREALKKLALKWEEAGAFDRVRLGDKGVAIQATYCDCADDLNQLLAETPTEKTL